MRRYIKYKTRILIQQQTVKITRWKGTTHQISAGHKTNNKRTKGGEKQRVGLRVFAVIEI